MFKTKELLNEKDVLQTVLCNKQWPCRRHVMPAVRENKFTHVPKTERLGNANRSFLKALWSCSLTNICILINEQSCNVHQITIGLEIWHMD